MVMCLILFFFAAKGKEMRRGGGWAKRQSIVLLPPIFRSPSIGGKFPGGHFPFGMVVLSFQRS
jgi:hypothetical protein